LQNDGRRGTNLSIQDKRASLKRTAASLTECLEKVSTQMKEVKKEEMEL